MKTPPCLLAPMLSLLAFAGLAPSPAAAGEVDWFKSGAKWGFSNGPEFPGASGGFAVEQIDQKNAGKLEFDFSGGGGYVVGGHAPAQADFNEVRFAVKGDTQAKILVRAEDANRECFQIKVDYTTPGEWQNFRVNLGQPQLVFGGDKNKSLDLPLRKIYLGATNKGASELGGNLKGTVYFADAEVMKN